MPTFSSTVGGFQKAVWQPNLAIADLERLKPNGRTRMPSRNQLVTHRRCNDLVRYERAGNKLNVKATVARLFRRPVQPAHCLFVLAVSQVFFLQLLLQTRVS